MRWCITILVGVLVGCGGVGVGVAAAFPNDWPQTAVVAEPLTLKPIAGQPLQLRRFECLWVVQPGSKEVTVLALGKGLKVRVKLIKTLTLPGWGELVLVSPQALPGPWWVERSQVRGGRVEIQAVGWVCRSKVRVVPGPISIHRQRLRRLAAAALPQALTERLLAGKVRVGDSMWLVEMALGMPQRSFMVNYFRDEQHYVYLRPGGVSILMRFKGGKLVGPLPKGMEYGR